MENLGCANCAAEVERRINELDDVADATITFATKQLRISGTHLDALVPQIQEICASIESEVKVVPEDSGYQKRGRKPCLYSGKPGLR
ncbi:MAG: heavy-metal-associated domain-containing protein [Lachnospiraceae bacterium]